MTTVSSRCHFGMQLARLGCVTVPCYLLTHSHTGGGRWTVVGKGLGSRLGELGVLTFASARRGIVPFLVKTMRPSVRRGRQMALSGHASRPPADQRDQRDRLPGGIDFTPRHRISTTLPSHQKRRGGAKLPPFRVLTLLHHRHDTTAYLATATSRQWTGHLRQTTTSVGGTRSWVLQDIDELAHRSAVPRPASFNSWGGSGARTWDQGQRGIRWPCEPVSSPYRGDKQTSKQEKSSQIRAGLSPLVGGRRTAGCGLEN